MASPELVLGDLTGITSGPDGNLWFLNSATPGHVGRITPSGQITQFLIPRSVDNPLDIAAGPDGNLWFTSNGLIGRISPEGIITEFFAGGAAGGIAVGPDSNLWFGTDSNSIGQITQSGVVTFFPVPRDEVFTESIVTGPDRNLWCTEFPSPGLIRMATNGSFVRIRIPRPAADITVGSDGNLWFTMFGNSDPNAFTRGSIGSMPPDASGVRQFFISDLHPSGITAVPDGGLWFVGNHAGLVGRITTQGALTQVALPSANSLPFEIAMGPDGNLWITEQGLPRKIARVTPDWVITEFTLPFIIVLDGVVVRNPSLLLEGWGILQQGWKRWRLTSKRRVQKRYSQLAEAVNRSADIHPAVTEIPTTNRIGHQQTNHPEHSSQARDDNHI